MNISPSTSWTVTPNLSNLDDHVHKQIQLLRRNVFSGNIISRVFKFLAWSFSTSTAICFDYL